MMQSGQDRDGNDHTRSLNRSPQRRIFGLGDLEPQHQQFAVDAGRSTGRVLLAHLLNDRKPSSILGRPTLFRDLQRQNALKPARCQLGSLALPRMPTPRL